MNESRNDFLRHCGRIAYGAVASRSLLRGKSSRKLYLLTTSVFCKAHCRGQYLSKIAKVSIGLRGRKERAIEPIPSPLELSEAPFFVLPNWCFFVSLLISQAGGQISQIHQSIPQPMPCTSWPSSELNDTFL
jgi:hypothetical protein